MSAIKAVYHTFRHANQDTWGNDGKKSQFDGVVFFLLRFADIFRFRMSPSTGGAILT